VLLEIIIYVKVVIRNQEKLINVLIAMKVILYLKVMIIIKINVLDDQLIAKNVMEYIIVIKEIV
jgi:hypothetical protein